VCLGSLAMSMLVRLGVEIGRVCRRVTVISLDCDSRWVPKFEEKDVSAPSTMKFTFKLPAAPRPGPRYRALAFKFS